MATSIVVPGGVVPDQIDIFRALNPKHLEDGLPGDKHFVMKATHAVDDGISTAISALISLQQLRQVEVIRQFYGPDFGVAQLNVGEAIAPVTTLGIRVLQQDAPEWGQWAAAHAILTGYQVFVGQQGRRQIRDFQRHLVKLARRRYYPPGSDVARSVA